MKFGDGVENNKEAVDLFLSTYITEWCARHRFVDRLVSHSIIINIKKKIDEWRRW